ncbi:meiotic recombination protein SPO11-1 isoform X2 [Vigna angularis]|uniref:meiotic recombination protein SPO11-1 isoform X2 n=1 Tax=Phaseolus angularis TaxID=3914 RepID=UPI0022B383C5|nr:meiotic recombination protein SPO11-1 isoform X2 [Vigna angularis]
MEGKRRRLRMESQGESVLLLTKIKEFTRVLLTDLTNGRSPLILIDRFRSYCAVPNANCFCASDLPYGKEALTLRTKSRAHRLVVMLRVMLIVQKLLQENKHSSKRDIYYTYPSLFLDQSVVDQAINDICILMQCSRHNLNVVSAGNGLTMGWIRFSEGERKFDCISSPNSVHPVPVHVEEVKVFQRLANDQFCNVNHCIVITVSNLLKTLVSFGTIFLCLNSIFIQGRGYPDIPTRRCELFFSYAYDVMLSSHMPTGLFVNPSKCVCLCAKLGTYMLNISLIIFILYTNRFLRLLVENLRLPVYCLVDCDPYGFDILTTYRFGSMQMAYDTKHLRVPEIRWLGAFPSDSERYFVPKQCILPLTAEDKRKVEAMLLRCYLQREVPQWRLELKLMLQKGVKFEIEALSAHALSFLSDSYIPSKIEHKLIM